MNTSPNHKVDFGEKHKKSLPAPSLLVPAFDKVCRNISAASAPACNDTKSRFPMFGGA